MTKRSACVDDLLDGSVRPCSVRADVDENQGDLSLLDSGCVRMDA